MPHLFVDISSHGFGHLTQTAPVLNALAAQTPLSLTIRCGHPHGVLARRIRVPFTHLHEASDFGFVMHDALRVDLPASALRYREMQSCWPALMERDARLFGELGADLVVSNISPVPIAAAAASGMRSVAMCSLNWADLFLHYFGQQPWAGEIHETLRAAYASADHFIRFTPGMPMATLGNVRIAGTIAATGAQRGSNARAAIAAALNAPIEKQWLLIAMGGIAHRLPIENWPALPGIQFLVPAEWQVSRTDCTAYEDSQIAFADLLPGADVLLTKPGYGTFAEAAAAGLPLLYVRRPDWPEEPFLVDWLHQHVRAVELGPADAERGQLADALAKLARMPTPALPPITGIADAIRIILGTLS